MEKEFVPYNLSLRMKELGFDEKCFRLDGLGKVSYAEFGFGTTPIPTWHQAFRWFRENYDLLGLPTHSKYTIMSNKWVGQPLYGNYNSYEEAETACLAKLIEIVEQKEN